MRHTVKSCGLICVGFVYSALHYFIYIVFILDLKQTWLITMIKKIRWHVFVDPISHPLNYRLLLWESRTKDKKLATSFNLTFRYIDDVILLNSTKFGDYVARIYPIKPGIIETTDTVKSASHLDLHLENDNEGRLKTKKIRQKRWTRN